MKQKKKTKILSVLLCFIMLCSILPTIPAHAFYETLTAEGDDTLETTTNDYTPPVGITMKKLEGQYLTETDNLGDDAIFVIKKNNRYYAMKALNASDNAYNSIPAVDITDWINDDGTLTVPSDTLGVAFFRYEERFNQEYGLTINGSNNFLEYTSSFDEDKKDYSANFKITTFTDGHYINNPYYDSTNETSGTMVFTKWWTEWVNTSYHPTHFYRIIADLRNSESGGKEFYFRSLGMDVEYTGEEVEGYLYYTDCRHEFTIRHAEYDPPTCMLKGCEEYWYCEGCNEYMKDSELNEHYGQEMPTIRALGHDWDDTSCKNCKRSIPTYYKITSSDEFNRLNDDTMFILVAEYNGKLYTLDINDMLLYTIDSNNDGWVDIYDIDKNGNNAPDVLEIDEDGNDIYDYLENDYTSDGKVDEEDYRIYFDMLCSAFINDSLYGQYSKIKAKEISAESDGSINVYKQNVLEFEIVDFYSQEEIDDYFGDETEQKYTWEVVKQFVIPNMFVTAPGFMPMDRQYKKRVYDHGDTENFALLFYDDYKDAFELPTINKEGSILVLPCYMDFMPEYTDFTSQIRLREYNDEIYFVVGEDYNLEGVEYIENLETGNYDLITNDKQACIYLYASSDPSHICEWSDWTTVTDSTHTRFCTIDGCQNSDTQRHNWDNGKVTATPTCGKVGTRTYTCTDCKTTKTEEIATLDHDWSNWTYESVDMHIRTCNNNCGVEPEFDSHSWGDWKPNNDLTHSLTCITCTGKQTEEHYWDDGVITLEPTEFKEGIKTYTCITCAHTKTETIPKLKHEHVWSDWQPHDDKDHMRFCMDDNCDNIETLPHEWIGNVIQEPNCEIPGLGEYVCQVCMHTNGTYEIEPLKHEWIRYSDNGDGTHTATCANPFCPEKTLTEAHEWTEWTKNEDGSLDRHCTKCSLDEHISPLEVTLRSNKGRANVGESIVFTAHATGGKAPYTYSFIVHNKTTNKWTRLVNESRSNRYNWIAENVGTYVFYTDVLDSNGTKVRSMPVTITVINPDAKPLTVTSTVSKNDIIIGDKITINAIAEGGTEPYTYSYIVYNETTKKWARLKDKITESSFIWTAKTAGKRIFYVDVTDANGTTVRSEGITVKTTDVKPLTIVATADKHKTVINEKVKFEATPSGGIGPYVFSIIVHNKTTNKWARIKDKVTANTFTWTAASEGTRVFYIDVTDSKGTTVRSKAITVVTEKITPLSATASANSNDIVVGDKVTFKTDAFGGTGSYTYSLIVYNQTTKKWARIKDNATSPVFTWTAQSEGSRIFYVDVKDSNGTVVRCNGITITTSKKADPLSAYVEPAKLELNIGQNATFTVNTSGGVGPYTYTYMLYNPLTKQYYTFNNNPTSNTLTWKASSAGERVLYIDVKDSQGNNTSVTPIYINVVE